MSGFWGIFLMFWFIAGLFAKKNVRMLTWGLGLRIVIALVIIYLVQIHQVHFLKILVKPNQTYSILLIIGTMFCGVGILFAIWARIYIGRNWGMPMSIKEQPELVDAGPYAYIRHPIYSGMLLATLGSSVLREPLFFVFFLGITVYFVYCAKQEEQLLTKQLPEQYPAYMQRTKMFIPFMF